MSRRSATWLKGLLIFGLTIALYGMSVGSAVIWDDAVLVFANPLMHKPGGLWKFWFSTEPPDHFPLTASMLWLEYQLVGNSPGVFHAINTVFHALSCVLLWRVLLRLRLADVDVNRSPAITDALQACPFMEVIACRMRMFAWADTLRVRRWPG